MIRWIWLSALGIAIIGLVLTKSSSNTSIASNSTTESRPDLRTSVSELSTEVALQSTRISDLETSVAEIPNLLASPIAIPEPMTLTITIDLSAKPGDINATTEGQPCAGTGKFNDLGPDTEIAIYDADEVLLVEGRLVESELIRAGTIFSDCRLKFVIEEIPFQTDYILAISNRSVMTLSYEELEVEEWSLVLHFGP